MDRDASKQFKPCDKLTVEDLAAFPIWGFDVSLEGSDPKADETWVRRYEFRSVPKTSDLLFAAAEIRPGTHEPQQGAITFRIVNGTPEWDGCVLLKPRYCAVSLNPEGVQRSYLSWALGEGYSSFFPIRYAANVPIGNKRFSTSGTIALPQT